MSEKKISKANTPSRLFAKDETFIKTKVKTFGLIDARFKDNSSAVRYYVALGIAAERRTDAANSLDDKIIKGSQKEVITESLLPVKLTLDDLIRAVENLSKQQNEHFTEANRNTDTLINRVEELNDFIKIQIFDLLKGILTSGKITEEALRNIIVLRSILYVFLLGYKTGRFEPMRSVDDRTAWELFVKAAHQKAQELSIEEMQHIAEGKLETDIIQKMASDLFTTVRELSPKPPVSQK